ncbi:conserved hypothetical protein [Lodderomyces elongisporus NRRL YB-4239]|uniref:Aminoacyl-transfer RNA synthetases class-II family profile domain-containing protein n=1 Tax=Lodderomyces elongisporus (strain ATCC 11503 / CBS 2605 / JCM 1781 / NBRC 1676 / NRRL YB-4239) TaxID=379508 RepID=A5DWG2_LODEL|nr:conserved hypothetical protein [Lodderomyces elongisporus NRRL YB-4239]
MFYTAFGGCSKRLYSTLPEKASTLAKFNFPYSTGTIGSITTQLDKYLNRKDTLITLHGHIDRKSRIRPTVGFGFLRDQEGDVIQFIADADNNEHQLVLEKMKKLTVEDSISITGYAKPKVGKEQGRQEETAMATRSRTEDASKKPKAWELVVKDLQILNSSNLDASRLEKLKQTDPEDIPPQFRYLQLRTKFFQSALRTRSKIAQLVRNTLVNNHDFVEIETPLLFKSTPEGAREFLVPTRTYDQFYALPQSPQQYKQILMASGFTRYFQLAKCFRDEDLRADRQPEFTQVDLEMSYINSAEQIMKVVEDVVMNIWLKICNRPTYTLNEKGFLQKLTDIDNNKVQFSKLAYPEALLKYGIDKPDLRSDITFITLDEFFIGEENSEFSVVEACVLRNALDNENKSSKNKLPKELTSTHNYSRRRPYVWAIRNDKDLLWYEKLVEKKFMKKTNHFDEKKLKTILNLKPGDILAISTRSKFPYENPTPLGKFRQLAIKEFPGKWQRPIEKESGELVNDYKFEDMVVGSWVVDFPLFNPVEISSSTEDPYPEYSMNKYESTHHPFTMCKSEDYELMGSNPLQVRGEHYDLVINGVEVGGGSRRIHDPALQKYVFEEILQIKHYDQLFGHLLKALSMGCPPHAGLALGFDRLCAMVVGSSSIRDVIAFPKNQSGKDLVVESPTEVLEKALNEYFITKKNNNK